MSTSGGSQRTGFRKDIQGLRALAVLLVVAFHARLPVPGGFTGVDVFFAISGFVITARLFREHDRDGSISLGSFYRQRFLRLTPALAAMVAITLVASSVILFPDQQRIAIQTGVGAMLLVANVVIARTTGGYFDSPAVSNPLLNTWSLSVEEQFYLLFPVIVVGLLAYTARRRNQRALVLALVVISTASLALAIWSALRPTGTAQFTWLNFYSPVGRVWEFGAGALLAVYLAKGRGHSPWMGQVLTSLGLVAILGAGLLVTEALPWPGPWTLVPVLGACAVIMGGALNPSGLGTRLLSLRPTVSVGDWSYSIYLWHWPFISLAVYVGVTEAPWLTLIALVSFVPAVLSYRFLEEPLRRFRPRRGRSMALLVGTVVGIPLIVAAVLVAVIRPSISHDGDLGPAYLSFIDGRSVACEGQLGQAGATRCRQSIAGTPPVTVVVGDSHAEHLYPGFLEAFPGNSIAYAYLENWPIWHEPAYDAVFDAISEDESVQNVVLGSRWTPEVYGAPELEARLSQLSAAGKQVFIANDGPYFSFHARECKYDRPLFDVTCSESSGKFEQDLSAYSERIKEIAAAFPNVHLLDTAAPWCKDGVCSMLQSGELMYADQGHLSARGSGFLIQELLASDPNFRAALTAAKG